MDNVMPWENITLKLQAGGSDLRRYDGSDLKTYL